MGWQGNKICWKVHRILQSWRNTNLLYNEWDQSCFCWTYNTIPVYRYMEDNGYKCIHKLTQFITTLKSQRNCSIDLIPKKVKNSDFSSNLYSKPLREFRKPKFKVRDRVRVSKYDLPFRKCYKPQFTKEVFKIVAIPSKKPPTYTIKDEQDEIIRGKFYQKELIKVN